ncbi:hypothetical protein VTJ49DRAFT_4750 [Mycothermus thermophilus]|uniref:Uncharacterized protein n=1 Tax=Humicola insolens TaxID=85995 RepID=A0ABR3V4N0_HUMIN
METRLDDDARGGINSAPQHVGAPGDQVVGRRLLGDVDGHIGAAEPYDDGLCFMSASVPHCEPSSIGCGEMIWSRLSSQQQGPTLISSPASSPQMHARTHARTFVVGFCASIDLRAISGKDWKAGDPRTGDLHGRGSLEFVCPEAMVDDICSGGGRFLSVKRRCSSWGESAPSPWLFLLLPPLRERKANASRTEEDPCGLDFCCCCCCVVPGIVGDGGCRGSSRAAAPDACMA